MKRTFEIEWPDDLDYLFMNSDNVLLCLTSYCANTKFTVTDITGDGACNPAGLVATGIRYDKGIVPSLTQTLASAISKHNAENGSNTPDFILAQYLSDCLDAFNKASKRREAWYGVNLSPGGLSPKEQAINEIIADADFDPVKVLLSAPDQNELGDEFPKSHKDKLFSGLPEVVKKSVLFQTYVEKCEEQEGLEYWMDFSTSDQIMGDFLEV